MSELRKAKRTSLKRSLMTNVAYQLTNTSLLVSHPRQWTSNLAALGETKTNDARGWHIDSNAKSISIKTTKRIATIDYNSKKTWTTVTKQMRQQKQN